MRYEYVNEIILKQLNGAKGKKKNINNKLM